MLGLLKFFLFLLLGVYLLRLAMPYLLKYLLQRMAKKMQDAPPQTPPSSNKTTTSDIGEYVDYEELDD